MVLTLLPTSYLFLSRPRYDSESQCLPPPALIPEGSSKYFSENLVTHWHWLDALDSTIYI